MDNSDQNKSTLAQRKAMLKAKLEHNRTLIREDMNDLKEDFNPFRSAGHLISNMLKPTQETQLTGSNALNFGVDTGISLLVSRLIPGANKNAIKIIAPVLIKNLATHVLPHLKTTAENALEWIAEKTTKKEETVPDPLLSNEKIKEESSSISG